MELWSSFALLAKAHFGHQDVVPTEIALSVLDPSSYASPYLITVVAVVFSVREMGKGLTEPYFIRQQKREEWVF